MRMVVMLLLPLVDSQMWTVSLSFLNCTIESGFANLGGGLCMFSIAGHGGKGSKEISSTILRIEKYTI